MPPRSWLVVTIEAPSAESAALLAEGLFAFGATAVEEQGNRLITYVPETTESGEQLVGRLAKSLAVQPADITWVREQERDWAEEWKRGLGPRRVGDRLIVTPTWIVPDAQPRDIVIAIDPQMAFGTGEHASTRGALRLIEPIVNAGARVLDVGTGSAVLAIAAALLGATDVIAVEMDPDALINARENVERNQVGDRVRLEEQLADPPYIATLGTFDLVFANILSSVIVPLLPAFRGGLTPDGALVVAGILTAEAETVASAAQAHGFTVEAEDREDEWWSARLRPR